MADALTAALVHLFVSRAFQRIDEEVRLVKDGEVKKKYEDLKKRLSGIQALLACAKEEEFERLENSLHKMDDVLDDCNFARKKADGEKQVHFCSPIFYLKSFIKELDEELDSTKNNVDQDNDIVRTRAIELYSGQQNTTRPFIKHNQKISLVVEIQSQVDEKKSLVRRLCESSPGGKGIDIIPIVGLAGIGKTTLAQLAYDDDSVKTHFDKRIWVCLSSTFNQIRIPNADIQALGVHGQNFMVLESLLQRISNSIKGKKFLLVLDNLCVEDKMKWEKLKQPLLSGHVGSKILVTTHHEKVEEIMGVGSDKITLKEWNDEACWSIIRELAYVELADKESSKMLENIGIEIAKKCKGLPFVAKVLGGLLSYKQKTHNEWSDVLKNKIWESKLDKEIFAPLLLSYYDLSAREKCCFAYCSIFPQGFEINRDELIEMWMSQGYFDDLKEGQDCFDGLFKRSFFQVYENLKYGGYITHYFKMNDIVHDFAQFLTKNKSIIIGGRNIKEKMEFLEEKDCHLTLIDTELRSLNEFLMSFKSSNIQKKCRTLLVLSKGSSVDCEFDISKLTSLRALFLSNHMVEYRRDFAHLKYLRYLDISFNFNLKAMPDALCDLRNLQTLKMDGCRNLERLSEKIEKLVNLRHLYITDCWKLEGLPKGIAKLTCLQKLGMLVIPKDREKFFHFGDGEKLKNKLQGLLRIRWCANLEKSEAENIGLKTMNDLEQLILNFRGSNQSGDVNSQNSEAEVLEALEPHPNLTVLSITTYGGKKYPNWMTSLTNLRFLTLRACEKCEVLPPLGKLPSLESLEIGYMPSVQKVGEEFLGITRKGGESSVSFPKLKKLSLLKFDQWKEWEGSRVAALKVMTCLHSLEISFCHSLEALPDFLRMTPLKELLIQRCEILSQYFQEGKGKEWLQNIDGGEIKLKLIEHSKFSRPEVREATFTSHRERRF